MSDPKFPEPETPSREQAISMSIDFLNQSIRELAGKPSSHDLAHARMWIQDALLWMPED